MKEIKVKPKFTTKFLSDGFPETAEIEKLRSWCEIFGRNGLMPFYGSGSYGNTSFRVTGNKFIITASGIKDPSSDDGFVLVSDVDLGNKTVFAEGTREPSSETLMHYLIYKNRKNVNAIFHGHSKTILKHAEKLGIPSTLKEEEYGTIELAKSILDVPGEETFLIMKGHGFISLGKDMDEAGHRTLKVLRSCS
jgi:L-fuculose-phosphate aldolase